MSGRGWRWEHLRYRVRCHDCGWTGYRVAQDCECYEDWAVYCQPIRPGPGCPSWVAWPCPKGHEAVSAKRAAPRPTPTPPDGSRS